MKSQFVQRTMLVCAALGVLFAATATAQNADIKSELKPNTVYTSTQVQTLEGFDGSKDIKPIITAQIVEIETGALTAGKFNATMKVYETVKGKTGSTKKVQSIIEFEVTSDGKLQNFNQTKGEGPVAANVAEMIAGQYLENILLKTKYNLKRNIKRTYNVTKTTAANTQKNLEFTFNDISPTPVENPNSTTKRTGKATFDSNLGIYTKSETVRFDRIIVPEDATGPGKEVRTTTTVQVATTVKTK